MKFLGACVVAVCAGAIMWVVLSMLNEYRAERRIARWTGRRTQVLVERGTLTKPKE